ncbi:MAG: PDZ domain-containing protein, partial [Gallionella sp.]
LTPELVDSFKLGDANGVLVTDVIRNSPAEKAGIMTGDILLAIDGHAITDWSSMLETVANTPPNKVVAVETVHNNKKQTLQVKIGKRPLAK